VISAVVVYAVVSAFRSALAVYNAIFRTSVVRSWMPWYNSFLKEVVCVWTIEVIS
jgi:hypothetical protein